MSELERREARAREEAAAWFARLGRSSVTTQALREFRQWRRSPANQAAYQQVEAAWSRSGGLAADPEIRAAAAAALGPRPWRRRLAGAGAALGARPIALSAAAAGLSVLAWIALGGLQPTYAAGVGEQRLVRLQDGSRVRLNTDSRVRIRYGPEARTVELLRGQALFEAAHDPGRPFLVRAGDTRVQALGTRFEVLRQEGQVRVTLAQGTVRVSAGDGRSWTLSPDQQLTLNGTSGRLEPADARQATSWTSGRLIFRGTALAQAVREVNRYAPAKLELQAPGLAQAPVSGVFDIGDSEAFAAAAARLFDLEARRRADGGLVLRPARRAAPGG